MRVFVTFAPGLVAGAAKPNFAIDAKELGGKGAGLAKMCLRGYPVPPGFTITTAVCRAYQQNPEGVMAAIADDLPEYLEWMKKQFGYMPLLSVRSGAPVSMPGMMDTILNVGLTSKTLEKWRERIGDAAALDSYRRLYQMYGEIVCCVPKHLFEFHSKQLCKYAGVSDVGGLTPSQMFALMARFEQKVFPAYDAELPDTVEAQVLGAIEAVFKSWNSDRAIEYRRLHKISDEMGTAVTVQAMVFGNSGDTSGTGVLFTRDPATGAPGIHGEFLPNAQGEDVVAGGGRQPMPFTGRVVNGKAELSGAVEEPGAYCLMDVNDTLFSALADLIELAEKLERENGDMQDIEFTIQEGKLWLLQTRAGKRTATAAFRIAQDMMTEGLIGLKDAAKRISAKQFAVAQRPTLDRAETIKARGEPIAKGLVGSTGVAIGKACFNAEHFAKFEGPKILVRHETVPDDIGLMAKSVGILTATGGFTSHAAVVARGMDKPCITACEGLKVDPVKAWFQAGSFEAGDTLTLNADTGEVWIGTGTLAETGADGAMGFLQRVMAANGVRLRTSDPVNGAHLVAGDALSRGELISWLATLCENKIEDALIDLRPPSAWAVAPEDRDFLLYCGENDGRAADTVRAAIPQLRAYGPSMKNCAVLLPAGIPDGVVATLHEFFEIVPTVTSLDQALAAKKPVALSSAFNELASSQQALQNLRHMILANGGQLADEGSMSLGEAAGALLGGAN